MSLIRQYQKVTILPNESLFQVACWWAQSCINTIHHISPLLSQCQGLAHLFIDVFDGHLEFEQKAQKESIKGVLLILWRTHGNKDNRVHLLYSPYRGKKQNQGRNIIYWELLYKWLFSSTDLPLVHSFMAVRNENDVLLFCGHESRRRLWRPSLQSEGLHMYVLIPLWNKFYISDNPLTFKLFHIYNSLAEFRIGPNF